MDLITFMHLNKNTKKTNHFRLKHSGVTRNKLLRSPIKWMFCLQILMNVMEDPSADLMVNVWTCPAVTRAIATLDLNCPQINIVKVRSQESWMDKQRLTEISHENNAFIEYFLWHYPLCNGLISWNHIYVNFRYWWVRFGNRHVSPTSHLWEYKRQLHLWMLGGLPWQRSQLQT